MYRKRTETNHFEKNLLSPFVFLSLGSPSSLSLIFNCSSFKPRPMKFPANHTRFRWWCGGRRGGATTGDKKYLFFLKRKPFFLKSFLV
jgi:hypothetical protein